MKDNEVPTVVLVFRALLAQEFSDWLGRGDTKRHQLRDASIPDSLIDGILSSQPSEQTLALYGQRIEKITGVSVGNLSFRAAQKQLAESHTPTKIETLAELQSALKKMIKNHGLSQTCRKVGMRSRTNLRRCADEGQVPNAAVTLNILKVADAESGGKWNDLPFLLPSERFGKSKKKAKKRPPPAKRADVSPPGDKLRKQIGSCLSMMNSGIVFLESVIGGTDALVDGERMRVVDVTRRLLRTCGIDAETIKRLRRTEPLSQADRETLAQLTAARPQKRSRT